MRPDLAAKWRVRALAGVLIAACPVAGHAACWSQKSEIVTMMSLSPDGTVMLADGRAMRLAGIEPPPNDMARAGWQKIFDEITVPVSLRPVLQASDRYGRMQMMVVTGEGALLQERLVAAGFARVMPQKKARDCLASLLAAEVAARQARRGLWRDPAFAPRAAHDIADLMRREGQYVLVEGKVVGVSERQRRLYINFGADWRTDFTVTVEPADAGPFIDEMTKGRVDGIFGLTGASARVRGFLTRYNGPEIRVTVSEQVEIFSMPDKEKDRDGG
tara:strand:- start:3252 stop:4073 length:822 start_codon:yes stop_codon:yes gene_type:complete